MLSLYTSEIKEYLKCDDVVDFDNPEVKALVDKLFAEAEGETDFVRRAYEFDKWIRLDARGNRSDVDAQFSVDEEKLAFPVRAEKDEITTQATQATTQERTDSVQTVYNTVKYYVTKLKRMNVIEREGSSQKGYWLVKYKDQQ